MWHISRQTECCIHSQRAAELKAAEEGARSGPQAKYFEFGKLAYERGQYPEAVQCLERAVEDVGGRQSVVGGEVQLWLALAYQVCWRGSHQ